MRVVRGVAGGLEGGAQGLGIGVEGGGGEGRGTDGGERYTAEEGFDGYGVGVGGEVNGVEENAVAEELFSESFEG